MKNLLTLSVLLFFFSFSNAQVQKGIFGKSNWFNNWTNFKPKTTEYDSSTKILTGVISQNTTLTKGNVYLMYNVVYVTNNAVLTIEPGTVIRGDFETCGTLVIAKGAKLIAEGTETDPIIFTSNKEINERRPGDWGGIIIEGDAPINKFGGIAFLDFNLNPKFNNYGGNNENDDSGILKFLRIEFAGRKLNSLKELNGLTLAGVGKKTKLDYIQISFSNDDSFECYGGDVSLNHLISYRSTDDDFDFTQGVQAQIDNSIAIRYAFSSDISRSRCFEVDSYDKIENTDSNKKKTKIVANNITLVNSDENNQGLIKEAITLKNDCYFEIYNSVVSGFQAFLLLEDKMVENDSILNVKLENIIVNNCNKFILKEKNNDQVLVQNLNENIARTVSITSSQNGNFFMETDIKKYPDFRLKSNNFSAVSMSN